MTKDAVKFGTTGDIGSANIMCRCGAARRGAAPGSGTAAACASSQESGQNKSAGTPGEATETAACSPRLIGFAPADERVWMPQAEQERGQAGGGDRDRHHRAGGPHLCAALPQLLRQGACKQDAAGARGCSAALQRACAPPADLLALTLPAHPCSPLLPPLIRPLSCHCSCPPGHPAVQPRGA